MFGCWGWSVVPAGVDGVPGSPGAARWQYLLCPLGPVGCFQKLDKARTNGASPLSVASEIGQLEIVGCF